MKPIKSIRFHGPFVFRAPGNTIANSEFVNSEGIYLWTLDLRVNHPEDKLFYPDDNRTTMRKVKLGYRLRVHCSDNIKGLSDSIEI